MSYAFRDGDGNLLTVDSFLQGSVVLPAQVLMDSTGAEKATASNPLRTDPVGTTTQPVQFVSPQTVNIGEAISAAATNPTSTLTLPSTTTAYSSGELIANNATAASVSVPSFMIANVGGGASIQRLRLSTNDTTSTAWGGKTIQVDLWSAAPTFVNGDRGAWSIATGTAYHLGSFSITMSAMYGDGAYGEGAPAVGNAVLVSLAGLGVSTIFWTLQAVGGSGVTGANKTFTLTAEVLN